MFVIFNNPLVEVLGFFVFFFLGGGGLLRDCTKYILQKLPYNYKQTSY